jgi:hypothetical protein
MAFSSGPTVLEPDCRYERTNTYRTRSSARNTKENDQIRLDLNRESSANSPVNASSPGFREGSNDLIPTHHSPALPTPDILRRLVNVFFAYVPFAEFTTHRPRFLQALDGGNSLSPYYPSTAFLHAICAIASLHAYEFFSTEKTPTFEKRPIFEIYVVNDELKREQGLLNELEHSFGEEHAAVAAALMEDDFRKGVNLMDALATCVVLSWYRVSLGLSHCSGLQTPK